MAIDNTIVGTFGNETIRPTSDLLATIASLPDKILAAAVGKGIPELLGTTSDKLLQAAEWTDADYAAIVQQDITGSDSDNRVMLTNYDFIQLSRVLVVLKSLISLHPTLPQLFGKMAVNPQVLTPRNL